MNDVEIIIEVLRKSSRNVEWMVRSKSTLPCLPPLEDMMPDINRLIMSIVRTYANPANPLLHFEDLVSECKEKLAKLLFDGLEKRAPTREKFFAFIKVAFKHHIYSHIQKHVFAFKRTGVKAPPRNQQVQSLRACEEPVPIESEHAVRLYLDDPDANVQVGEPFDTNVMYERELVDELKAVLWPVERLVLDQLLSPNAEAMVHSQIDAYRGKNLSRVNFRVNYRHMAEGLGITIDLFQQAMVAIKQKYKMIMIQEDKQESPEQQQIKLAELTLCRVFCVQVPPTIDSVTKRRLFTLVARDQADKITTEIANLLVLIGAQVPHKLGDQLSCHGVLWQRNHRICMSCGAQDSCKVKAVNLGLGDMVLSPRLLGAKLSRIPVILPNQPPESDVEPERGVLPQNNRDEDVLSYLNDSFKPVMHMGEIYYKFNERLGDRDRLLFCVGEPGSAMRLRFCNPHESVRESLRLGNRKGWYVPDNLTAQEVIEVIDQHTKAVLL